MPKALAFTPEEKRQMVVETFLTVGLGVRSNAVDCFRGRSLLPRGTRHCRHGWSRPLRGSVDIRRPDAHGSMRRSYWKARDRQPKS